MTDAPTEQKPNRGFLIGLGVLIVVALLGLFFLQKLSSYSPADVERANLIQREANAWKKIQAQLRGTHTREDEIAAYEGFLKQFPPGNPPTKHEADAQTALATINAQRAPDIPPP